VRGYIHDLIIFLRTHRAVSSGVSALATQHFNHLSRVLAPLHGLTFITPSLVALAFRKIYAHRIILTAPEDERTLQWGSSVEAVREFLRGMTVDDVLDGVLDSVPRPL
jgi:MoxR-like ATPase